MKKLFFFAMCAAMVLGITSCSGDGALSKSSAKSALQDSRLFLKDGFGVEFLTGYYEVNDAQIANLAKLQAAGVIDYSIDECIEYVDHIYGGYYRGYYKQTTEIKHKFAEVTLTEAGKKYEVEKPEWYPKYLAKYAKAMKDYEEVVPDYMKDGDDTEVEETEAVVAEAVEAEVVGEYLDYYEETDWEDGAAEDKDTRNDAYNKAKGNVNTEEHYMLMGKVQLEEVVLVECTEEMFKNGDGKCSFVLSLKDKTPFGFVYSNVKEGAYFMGDATFTLTNNHGWIAKDVNVGSIIGE